MQSLQATLVRLEQILTPPTSYTNDTVVLYPDATESDPAAALKRELWERFVAILDAGKTWLHEQKRPAARHLSGSESEEIESVLAQDFERRAFQEALHTAQTAENLLHEAAA